MLPRIMLSYVSSGPQAKDWKIIEDINVEFFKVRDPNLI
jgi:hypothetical protein